MNKSNCEIIRDILPLYIDDACSDESRFFIEGHIKECEECKELLKLMQKEEYIPKTESVSADNGVEILKKVNKKIVRKQITIAVITAIILGGIWAYFFILETNNPYKNNFGTEISNVEDIMYYFKYAFFPYIVLFIVVITNLFKFMSLRKAGENSISKAFSGVDLVIDVLCGVAMGAGLVFQGVLADNNAVGAAGWCSVLLIISLISFIIFIINLGMVVKRNSAEK